MKRRVSPFLRVDGAPHHVVNFDLGPVDIPLPDLLTELLRHHPADSILILRPLTKGEQTLFASTTNVGMGTEVVASSVIRSLPCRRRLQSALPARR